MASHLKPALLLILITPLLTELLTTNNPLFSILNPATFGFLVAAYGFPVLLVREIYVRRRLGFTGLFLLGLAYGILNEGVVAQTLLTSAPIPELAGYGEALGIHFAWSLIIVVWHAFHSVIFPLAIVHFLFPESSGKSWIQWKKASLLAIPVYALGFVLSLYTNALGYFIAFSAAMAVLSAVAIKLPGMPELLRIKTKPSFSSRNALSAGIILGFLNFWAMPIMAGTGLPAAVSISIELLFISGTIVLLKMKGWTEPPGIVLYAIGSYLVFNTFGLIFMLGKSPVEAISCIVFYVFFAWLARKAWTNKIPPTDKAVKS
jgi:hypothetical protein